MSKEMTAKEKLLARVAAMQKQINAAAEEDLQAWAAKLDSEGCEAKLTQEADAAAAAEKANAEKSTGVDANAAADGQNARANANWPMSANLKTARRLAALASREANTVRRMLALAGKMQADDAECDETMEACASSKLVAMAVKRSRSAATMMKMARKAINAKDVQAEDDGDDGDDDGKPFESRDSKVAARLVAIAKSLIGEDEEAPATTAAAPAEPVTDSDDSGKEIAAALLELAKSLSTETK